MEEEIKDVLIEYEKEKEIKFSLSFRVILGISIFLTGVITFGGFVGWGFYLSDRPWNYANIRYILIQMMFYISIVILFISLISIAFIKRPFSKILVWCIMAIGLLFTVASFIFPHIQGYDTGFQIFSFGGFTLIDGTYFMLGLLGILFARILHYGFIYQKDADMTV
jgi:magnesium-transporting ATPase (P-type)